MSEPVKADPEVAALTFREDLDDFFRNGRGRFPGWERIDVDPLRSVICLPASRADGTVDIYNIRLGAEYYDVWPPAVAFVYQDGDGNWVEALKPSRWWPNQQNQGPKGLAFGLHDTYQYPDGRVGQLACFSHSLDYYFSGHNPTDDERWRQGTHTLTATLTRLAEILRAPNYIGPSA